jgi:predicted nucleic-acid-binding protein
MIALDTNILARIATNDTPQQAKRAANLIDSSGALFVPVTVSLELEWTLRGPYKMPRTAIVKSFEGFLSVRNLNFERSADIHLALQRYQAGFDFADALHHAGVEGCDALATFDKLFEKLAAKAALQPPVIVPGK